MDDCVNAYPSCCPIVITVVQNSMICSSKPGSNRGLVSQVDMIGGKSMRLQPLSPFLMRTQLMQQLGAQSKGQRLNGTGCLFESGRLKPVRTRRFPSRHYRKAWSSQRDSKDIAELHAAQVGGRLSGWM